MKLVITWVNKFGPNLLTELFYVCLFNRRITGGEQFKHLL